VSTFLDEAGEANTGRLGVEDPDARLGGATSTQCYAGGRDTELDIRDRWQAPRPSTLQDKTRQESSHVSNQGADSELDLVLEGHLLADLRGFFLEHGQDGQFVRLKDGRLLTVGVRGGSRDGTPSVESPVAIAVPCIALDLRFAVLVVAARVLRFGVALFDSPRSDRRAVLLGM